jgi:hypothetical protein
VEESVTALRLQRESLGRISGHIVRVVGIDPAPTKGFDAFDGRDHRLPLADALRFVDGLRAIDDVLICWDAPLTGPPRSVVEGGAPAQSVFSQRPIEQFFSRNRHGSRLLPASRYSATRDVRTGRYPALSSGRAVRRS